MQIPTAPSQPNPIPFDRIEKIGQVSLLHRDTFCVSWLLGRYCNYSCSYCWPYAHSKAKDHRPTEVLLSTLDEIKRQARERGFNSFHFSFSGGEPTAHTGLLDMLTHYAHDSANCNYQSVHMTTNLSAGKSWWQKFISVTANLDQRSVTASYHAEFTTPDAFADKALLLLNGGVHVTVNIVMLVEKFTQLWKDAEVLYNLGINVTLKPRSNESATSVVAGYNDDMLAAMQRGFPLRDYVKSGSTTILDRPEKMQVEMTDNVSQNWYLDQAERLNAFGFNKFQGWECSAGYRSIIIREPDGSIRRSYSCSDIPLGYVGKSFKLFETVMPCQTKTCVSSADSKIPKRKAGTLHSLFREGRNRDPLPV